MAKKYYWIKLNIDFFQQDKIDFLMSQKNGASYIVLYEMLCLKTANNNGSLSSMVGDIIVPYNIEKIVRDCKYFERDTVMIAMDLYKKLGLIYQGDNEIMQIANYGAMIGYESTSAHRVRDYRKKQKALHCNKNVTNSALHCNIETETDIETDIEDVSSDKLTNTKRSVCLLETLEILKCKLDEVHQKCYGTLDDSSYNRLCNLFEKISYEQKIKIGQVDMTSENVLQGLIDIFRRDEQDTAKLIIECWYIVDTGENIKNKYKYAIGVFYNKAKGL